MRQAYFHGIGNQFAVALPAHHVKLSIRGLLPGNYLSVQFGKFDFCDDEEIPHSIGLFAQEVGRLPVVVETFEYFVAGLFGDGGGVASEEGQSLAALTPKRLQFLDDALWQVDRLPWHLDSDQLG